MWIGIITSEASNAISHQSCSINSFCPNRAHNKIIIAIIISVFDYSFRSLCLTHQQQHREAHDMPFLDTRTGAICAFSDLKRSLVFFLCSLRIWETWTRNCLMEIVGVWTLMFAFHHVVWAVLLALDVCRTGVARVDKTRVFYCLSRMSLLLSDLYSSFHVSRFTSVSWRGGKVYGL